MSEAYELPKFKLAGGLENRCGSPCRSVHSLQVGPPSILHCGHHPGLSASLACHAHTRPRAAAAPITPAGVSRPPYIPGTSLALSASKAASCCRRQSMYSSWGLGWCAQHSFWKKSCRPGHRQGPLLGIRGSHMGRVERGLHTAAGLGTCITSIGRGAGTWRSMSSP